MARTTSRRTAEGPRGNYVSEWFGHRVYPTVVATPKSIDDQRTSRCPFLTTATGAERICVKPPASLGICTISSTSNGPRQDWLVCPYRAVDPTLVDDVARRLFGKNAPSSVIVVPGPQLAHASMRKDLLRRMARGDVTVVFFQANLGGEISLPATDRSPELAFDITLVELVATEGRPVVTRYGVLEVQTMDFHGSYRAVVKTSKMHFGFTGSVFIRRSGKTPPGSRRGSRDQTLRTCLSGRSIK